MSSSSPSSLTGRIENGINKCFLILDQIEETVFPLLEQAIYERNSSEVAKLTFVVQHRIQAVESDAEKIHKLFNALLRSDLDSLNLELTSNRIEQLKFEQNRIQRSYRAYQAKIAEKTRKEKEEDILTRRITTFADSGSSPSCNAASGFTSTTNFCDSGKKNSSSASSYVSLDLATTPASDCCGNAHCGTSGGNNLKGANSQKSPSKSSRNQKTLVKRVRTRYLNLSNNFVETSKLFFGPGVGDWILFFAILLVITTAIFCIVIWNTSPSRE